MSLAIRVIPCLDVNAGRVVKGVNFENLRDAGDPVELAARYNEQGADELTFLDISATNEGRATTRDMVRRCAETVFIPLTVGGGVRSVEDVDDLLRCGADKVGINTAAIANPQLLTDVSNRFGKQVVVLSLDARRQDDQPSGFGVTTHGGKRPSNLDAIEWAKEAQDRGVGEILLTSMDADGTTSGFDIEMIKAVREVVDVPIIASGGAGTVQHFIDAAKAGADALLAASVFHYETITIAEVKQGLANAGIEVRK